MSDPTLGAVGIVPAPDDVQAAAPRALAWLARRLSRDERIPGPPGKLAPFARRQRERALQHIVVHPGLQPLALLVETKASRKSGRIYQDLFNSESRTSESLGTRDVAMQSSPPLPRAGVLPELIAHDLVHSLPAEGLVDLLGRNEPVGEGVENPLLVRRDLHDSLVDGRVTARAGDA